MADYNKCSMSREGGSDPKQIVQDMNVQTAAEKLQMYSALSRTSGYTGKRFCSVPATTNPQIIRWQSTNNNLFCRTLNRSVYQQWCTDVAKIYKINKHKPTSDVTLPSEYLSTYPSIL